MITGSIHLNNLTDKQLVTVLETKIRHEGAVFFNPQQIQPSSQSGRPGITLNNNVIVSWNAENGYIAVLGLLAELANHTVAAKQAA